MNSFHVAVSKPLQCSTSSDAFSVDWQALEALAIVTFVCNERQDTKDAMAFMWEIISHDSQVYHLQRSIQEHGMSITSSLIQKFELALHHFIVDSIYCASMGVYWHHSLVTDDRITSLRWEVLTIVS